ncbi:hypothetical protein GIB67_021228 [Kingdonia uniflora]|uniref:Tetraspanin-19 n=1 Tax=Kingdonia uniflora TaxID=39325 RepID=A0A7J7LFQ6_9MAGN|nr:hypothetical protein GIB67_021228 [Kingdonia uniflora]
MVSMMRSCLQWLLKLVNSIIGMVGIAMIVYALWMLRVWQREMHNSSFWGDSNSPVPWFVYASLAIGISLCVITCFGHIAAETAYGHCLSCGRNFVDEISHSYTLSCPVREVGPDIVVVWRLVFTVLSGELAVSQGPKDAALQQENRLSMLWMFGWLKEKKKKKENVQKKNPISSLNCSLVLQVKWKNLLVNLKLEQYMVLVFILFLLEAAVAADVFLNRNWEKDFPDDPTGKFDELKHFVKSNFDVCKWIGVSIVAAQGLSILLSMILRALGPGQGKCYDSDEDYESARLPLLNNQSHPPPYVVGEPQFTPRNDTWNARVHEKIPR